MSRSKGSGDAPNDFAKDENKAKRTSKQTNNKRCKSRKVNYKDPPCFWFFIKIMLLTFIACLLVVAVVLASGLCDLDCLHKWLQEFTNFTKFAVSNQFFSNQTLYRITHWYGFVLEASIGKFLSLWFSDTTVVWCLTFLCYCPSVVVSGLLLWYIIKFLKTFFNLNNNSKPKSKTMKNRKQKDSNISLCTLCNTLTLLLCVFLIIFIMISVLNQLWTDTAYERMDTSNFLHKYTDTITRTLYLLILATIASMLLTVSCKLVKWGQQPIQKKSKGRPKNMKTNPTVAVYDEKIQTLFPERRRWPRFVFGGFMLCTAISVPWEFVRMYQQEAAVKMAVLQGGIPPECFPQELGIWASMKSWLKWQFSWDSTFHCEKYHQALLVDPLWEVTPLMVITSTFSRCITRPVEIFSHSLGQSLQLIFAHIPLIWQPIVMLILTVIVLTLAVMKCRYKISVPLFVRIEPSRTPQNVRVQSIRGSLTKESDGHHAFYNET